MIADLALGMVTGFGAAELPAGPAGAGGPSACHLTAGASARPLCGAALEADGLDALLVTHLPNIRYLTGLHRIGRAAAAPARRHHADHRFPLRGAGAGRGGRRRRWWRSIRRASGTGWAGCSAAARPGRSGIEAHALTVRDAERVGGADPGPGGADRATWSSGCGRSSRPRKWRPSAPPPSWRRRRWPRCCRRCGSGRASCEIGAELEAALRRRGSEWHPFPTIVASGPRSALPHARTSPRTVGAGEWLLLDFGAQVDGYCADLTRTVVVGARADERQRAIYELVQDRPAAGARAPAGRHDRPRGRRARPRRHRGPRVRRRVRPLAGPRARARGARGAPAGADRRGAAAGCTRW